MNTKVVIWFLSLALNCSYAYVLPKWSDIFSSLEPYKDEETLMLEEMEDNGEPRIGFVQLNSGSTTYNATLNLTGHILLGLGIASSLLLYMFFNAFDSAGDSGGYSEESSGYGFFNRRSKRSIEEEAELTFMVGDAIDQYTLSENAGNFCKEKLMCEAVKLYSNHHQSTEKNPIKTLKDVLHREFSLLDSISQNHTRKKCQDGIPRDCPLEMQAIKAILATPLT